MRNQIKYYSIILILIFIVNACDTENDENIILSDDNFVSEFIINTSNYSIPAIIDNENGIITKRLPSNINLKDLKVSIKTSNGAKSNLSNEEIKDFSSNKNLVVTSESGISREYTVTLKHMDQVFEESCEIMNAWKWFGGDNRKSDLPEWQPFDRNVGTGQAIILDKDLHPLSFSINLREGFRYDDDKKEFKDPVKLKLLIRNNQEKLITETTTEVNGDFNGGFIDFNLEKTNIFFEKNKTYIFQWYLINGETLGITASSSGNTDELIEGFCFKGGFSGESRVSKRTNISNPSVWGKHPWNFNFKLSGEQ